MTGEGEITGLLNDWGKGDAEAGDALMPLVYDELHRCADRLFRRESAGHTLQPTALVHEAFAKLVKIEVPWQDRSHFYALSARMMKRLLINHANARMAAKRGGGAIMVTLDDGLVSANGSDLQLVELADALSALEEFDPRKAELVELKYFGGLSTEEMASVTGLSVATIGRDLRFARAWLKAELTSDT